MESFPPPPSISPLSSPLLSLHLLLFCLFERQNDRKKGKENFPTHWLERLCDQDISSWGGPFHSIHHPLSGSAHDSCSTAEGLHLRMLRFIAQTFQLRCCVICPEPHLSSGTLAKLLPSSWLLSAMFIAVCIVGLQGEGTRYVSGDSRKQMCCSGLSCEE